MITALPDLPSRLHFPSSLDRADSGEKEREIEMPETEVSDESVQRLQHFVQNRQAAVNANEPLNATALHAYARRLDGTLRELHEQLRRQEDELKKARDHVASNFSC